jgi:hypothetical protein
MTPHHDDALRMAALRAYEIGRLRTSVKRALAITLVVALGSLLLVGTRALPWLAVTFGVWLFVEWRGGWLLRGARRGLLAGAASLMVPLSVLRPCCATHPADAAMAMDCCHGTMPGTCAAVGATIGLSLSLLVPSPSMGALGPDKPFNKKVAAAAGMALGAISVALLRCAPLLVGEGLGLLGGLFAGVVAASAARAVIDRRRTVQ